MNTKILTVALVTVVMLQATGHADEKQENQTSQNPAPPYKVVELYAPGHFGNSYECMGQYEMLDMLKEARFWGCTRYGDWFDMLDCSDPFRKDDHWGLSRALWWAKKLNFRSAVKVGLETEFLLTPNHTYVDRLQPAYLSEDGHRRGQYMFGQLICPSKPEARKLIQQDYDRLFADIARSGVRLRSMSSYPYDYGGCGCNECHPWIISWGKLCYEIYEAAIKHHPDIEMTVVGWCWKPEEHKIFAEWADKHHPGWIKAMYLHIPYGKTTVADVPLPKGCAKGAFVHIGYGELANPRDVYGHYGPTVAPARLQKTLQDLKKQGVSHLMAYSEGQSDDLNKAIFAGLGSGKFKTSDEVITAYAKRYFGTDNATSARWAKWLSGWGAPFQRDTIKAKTELEKLLAKTPNRDSPRVREWVLKTELFDINRKIGSGDKWTPERLELAEQYWQTREKIHRGIWGLGPQRHIFARKFLSPPWYRSWAKHHN
ncbi:MAG: hypothetical protein JXM70_08145 [Pirellulales bacterium]|nr:hypothetical protein [Pirellulales bacterium]